MFDLVGPLKVEVKDELLKQEPGDLLEAIKANAGAQNNLFLLQLPGKTDTEVRRPDPAAAKPAEGITENLTMGMDSCSFRSIRTRRNEVGILSIWPRSRPS